MDHPPFSTSEYHSSRLRMISRIREKAVALETWAQQSKVSFAPAREKLEMLNPLEAQSIYFLLHCNSPEIVTQIVYDNNRREFFEAQRMERQRFNQPKIDHYIRYPEQEVDDYLVTFTTSLRDHTRGKPLSDFTPDPVDERR